MSVHLLIVLQNYQRMKVFALQDNIAKYESMFGKIEINEGRTYSPSVSEFHGDA